MLAAMLINTDCKKQVQCGCGRDVIKTYEETELITQFTAGDAASIMFMGNIYDYYTPCNPDFVLSELEKYAKSNETILVSGKTYWDCSYVMQASQYGGYGGYGSYGSVASYYNIEVTEIKPILYGKK